MMFNKQNAVHKLLTANLSCWMFQIYKKYKDSLVNEGKAIKAIF